MLLHDHFPGGNIHIVRSEGDDYYIEQELRDTIGWWFYWGFCVEGAQGRTITFNFTNGDVLGYHGPAISHDNLEYHWAGSQTLIDGHTFIYTFGAHEKRVFFRYALPYQLAHYQNWLRAQTAPILTETLCATERGRNLPCSIIGDTGAPRSIVLTCRHHACESMAAWVLEGALDELILMLPRLSAMGLNIAVVPFVDLDGVEDGDQGKARAPHDHNRDYTDAPIYNVTRAIKRLVKRRAPAAFIDFHDPWYLGGVNDYFCILRKPKGTRDASEDFVEYLMEETASGAQPGDVIYKGAHDLFPGDEWVPETPNPSRSVPFFKRSGAKMAISMEIPYFGDKEFIYTQVNAKRLGRCVARALERVMQVYTRGEITKQ